MHLTPEIEEMILNAISAKMNAAGVLNVFKNPFYFETKEDFAARAQDAITDDLEVRFAMIRFRGYQDAPNRPLMDNPTTNLNYRITVFFQYKAVRDDLTNSRQDFTRTIINLRNEFLNSQVILRDVATNNAIVEHKELVPLGEITENETTRFLTDETIKGDSIEYSLLVEVA